MRKSPGGNGGVRLGDVQVVAGVAEHDPRRRLARAARDRDCGGLPRCQHRLKLRDSRLLGQALPLQFIQRDRQVPHALPGCVIDRVGDRRRDADDANLAQSLDAEWIDDVV